MWESDVSTERTSYSSLLNLAANETGDTISYFTFNTPEELDHLFTIFKKTKYDVFYLASHMRDGNITSGYKRQFINSILSILKRNKLALSGKILHLAGCSSLSSKYLDMKEVKKICNLKAISGYDIDTYTTESAAMDLLYLTYLSTEGIKGLLEKLTNRYGCLVSVSGFKIYMLKDYK